MRNSMHEYEDHKKIDKFNIHSHFSSKIDSSKYSFIFISKKFIHLNIHSYFFQTKSIHLIIHSLQNWHDRWGLVSGEQILLL